MLTPKDLSGMMSGSRQWQEPDPLTEFANSLAREFDAPVGLLATGERIWLTRIGLRTEQYPDPEDCACTALGQGEPGRVFVWQPGRTAGPLWLGIPVSWPGDRQIVAVLGFATEGMNGASESWGPVCPGPALLAWGQSVADRLRKGSGAEGEASDPSTASSSSQLTNQLIRRLRVSDAPERYQELVTRSMREELGATAVAWVPANPREPVVFSGSLPGRGVEVMRTWLPQNSQQSVAFLEEVGPAGPMRIAVVSADKEGSAGWLVLIAAAGLGSIPSAHVELMRNIAPLVAAQRSNARLYCELKDLMFGIIRSLSSAIDAKDPYTSGHSERVARIAVRLGEQLGLNANQRGDLYLMGLLHDIGKIGIDDGVLKKPGPLTPDEYRQIQSHVKIGVHILSDLRKLHHVLPGVAHHHECMDGSGYPSGLAGESIPLPARILAVADAYDAMSSTRPYRRRLSPKQMREIMSEGSGTQWDPKVVQAIFDCWADVERIRSKGLGESLKVVVGDTLGRNEGP